MRIGIDLGGTKIEGVAIADDGSERLRRRIPAPRGDYASTLAAVTGLVRGIETELGVEATIGIGIPGAISHATGRVKNANSTWLNGTPLPDDLARMLDRPIRLANDANCFALSEAIDGAGAGAGIVFGVIVGTGTGGGVVVDGTCSPVSTGWRVSGGTTRCRRREATSRRGRRATAGAAGASKRFCRGPHWQATTPPAAGPGVTAQEIAARAAGGEALAMAALDRYEDRMARALASVINLLDPHVIVLGGGLSNIDRLYDRVPQLWAPYVFSDTVTTRLLRAVHGDSSGVRGAAWLWNNEKVLGF
jgi:predicted NBD/HSP70 family sugar kinase